MKRETHRRTLGALGLALAVLGLAVSSLLPTAAKAQSTQIATVFVIVMENENWSAIQGNPDAPYINHTLLPMASLAQQYFTPPGNHPSEPNYLWLEAGTNFGIHTNDPPAINHQASTAHLSTLLSRAQISWKAYEEGIDGTRCPLVDQGRYAVRHNPMVFFDDVTDTNNADSTTCIAHERPFAELAHDLSTGQVARYNFLTPDLCDDMHDACPPTNNPIRQGDAWLSQQVPLIVHSPAYQHGGALFVTWDEGTADGDGPMGLLALSPLAKGHGYATTLHYTHSSLLRSLQDIFGVTPLLGDAASAPDLSDLFLPGALGQSTTLTPCASPPPSPQSTPAVPSQATPTLAPTGTASPAAIAPTATASTAGSNDDEGDGTTSPVPTVPPLVPALTAATPTTSPCCPQPTASSPPSATATPAGTDACAPRLLPAGMVSSLLPAYWGDDTAKWADLERRHVPGSIAIASFPGTQDATFATILQQAHATGLRVLGYVGTGNTPSHSLAQEAGIEGQIAAWDHYPIDGIFLDEAVSLIRSDADSGFYHDLYHHIKEQDRNRLVALNIGWMPSSEQIMQDADLLTVFEGSVEHFSAFSPAAWMLRYPASRFSAIIENVPNQPAQITALVQTGVERDHLGFLFVQDLAQHYEHLPPYWDAELAALTHDSAPLAPAASPTAPPPTPTVVTATPADSGASAASPAMMPASGVGAGP